MVTSDLKEAMTGDSIVVTATNAIHAISVTVVTRIEAKVERDLEAGVSSGKERGLTMEETQTQTLSLKFMFLDSQAQSALRSWRTFLANLAKSSL